jgi:methylglyoxal synthase
MARLALGLVAHDDKKESMAEFVAHHRERIAGFDLFATGTRAARFWSAAPSSLSRV